ncbi:hypothetical protein LTR48_002046 [Friedmanniomyces endolithicus]|uniref:Uncharacterized protein n=1 Tax=Rachicladosporium monterosium TaxID=1507873 RepID=A0ABR0LFD2_9PEZI|nr:hypothetical protein LTR29_016543 [Friedmanniomyces endolithicus]KAK1093563.1 hypothetical protein LTR48_002046 [Friedmanniomyces endolithicus]KAK5147924.1 hypothetical protein LTR32_000674 [Rachicladosporium monterosium]
MADQVKYTNKLKDQRVLVIGGSSGIGFGVAEACLENGSIVIISSSNQDRIQKTIEMLQKAYPSAKDRITGHACNLGDQSTLEDNLKQLFEKVASDGKKLDHIVFTAADPLAVMKISEVDMPKLIQAGLIRFFAPLLVAKHAPQYLNPGPESSITLTTGSVSERPRPDWAAIGSFATGLQGMCRSLALDLKPIRVNVISPGAVDTELWSGMSEQQRKDMFEQIEGHVPTGRVARVEDVAEAYLYVMRDRNVTGSMISTNGGHLVV